jgi:hypothetical protein
MAWLDYLHGDPRSWLLEPDPANPGVRYFALRDLMDCPEDDPEVRSAQDAAMATGPIAAILTAQRPEGWWEEDGPGYYPKYTGTVWSVIFLAQLGARGDDPRVRAAGEVVLRRTRAPEPYGGFSMNERPTGMIHCLQGNLGAALLDLGWAGDPRLETALDWLARSITGEGIAAPSEQGATVRYYLSGNCAPGFACAANDRQACAWGAVKAALALARVAPERRTPVIARALAACQDFLLSRDPAVADYPMGYNEKPSRSWFQFGYPIGYVTDVLQNVEALLRLARANVGTSEEQRSVIVQLKRALELVLTKQDSAGRWKMEYTYNGKLWADVETKGQPSKWVTLRALRALKMAG